MINHLKTVSGYLKPDQKIQLYDIETLEPVSDVVLNRDIETWRFTDYQVLSIEPEGEVLKLDVSITNNKFDITEEDIKTIIQCLDDENSFLEKDLSFSNCKASKKIVRNKINQIKDKLLEVFDIDYDNL